MNASAADVADVGAHGLHRAGKGMEVMGMLSAAPNQSEANSVCRTRPRVLLCVVVPRALPPKTTGASGAGLTCG